MHLRFSALPVLVMSFAALAVAACGGSSSASTPTPSTATSTPSAASTPTATAGPLSLTCPTESTLNSALGLTLSTLHQQPTTGEPAGDVGVSCQYTSATARQVAILELGSGPVQTNFIAIIEAAQQKAATQQGQKYTVTSVSGVGSNADFITFSKAGSPTEDGILAETGNAGIIVTVVPPASQSQLQAFASQLLG